MLIFIFGLAGSGKNYVGEIISQYLNCNFVDADTWLPDDMLAAIRNKQSFTQEMRDNFTQAIVNNTKHLITQQPHKGLVITQALYKLKNRLMIKNALPQALFIQVVADPNIINERLIARGDHIPPDYAQLISKNFEPSKDVLIVDNNKEGTMSIMKQIKCLFPIRSAMD